MQYILTFTAPARDRGQPGSQVEAQGFPRPSTHTYHLTFHTRHIHSATRPSPLFTTTRLNILRSFNALYRVVCAAEYKFRLKKNKILAVYEPKIKYTIRPRDVHFSTDREKTFTDDFSSSVFFDHRKY